MSAATTPSAKQRHREAGFVLLGILVVIGALAGGHMAMMRAGYTRPAGDQFGLGPRTSASGIYTATLVTAEPMKPRVMQTLQVTVVNGSGEPVDGAHIVVDGGMPQHGHGLPTRPRVTRNLGNGVYEIEGVRFNMPGWWEFTLSIAAASGTDLVTFNLSL